MQNTHENISTNSLATSKSRTIAATGLFAALSILLTVLSQFMGLNFPIVPYLQFDFGEVAILLAFFLFGPSPAVAASVVEFLTLMAVGENTPYGPILKIIAILSSLAGLWMGMYSARRILRTPGTIPVLGAGFGLGIVFRVLFMTIANYILIAFLYTVGGTIGLVESPFKAIGISISNSNALALILGFTGVFNCLQLALVFGITYFLLKLPQLRHPVRTGRLPWFESFTGRPKERE
ncbi:MAG: hypothetical protein JRN15_17170 [Nitrososphaerota archaeon]|nr:hypothetical protein [Nitrososphaerota archaeon]